MVLRCDLRDAVSRGVYFRGLVDAEVGAWMRGWLGPGDTYVDVGAHIGSTISVAAEAIGSSGAIVGFEPHPQTFALLQAAIKDAKRPLPSITLHQAALGSEAGEATIYDRASEYRGHSSHATLVGGGAFSASGTVPVVTLDDVLADVPIRLLKIDIEGFEEQALRGAARVLGRCEAVLIELNPGALERAGSSPETIVGLLGDHGLRAQPNRWLEGAFEDVVFVRG